MALGIALINTVPASGSTSLTLNFTISLRKSENIEIKMPKLDDLSARKLPNKFIFNFSLIGVCFLSE